MVKDRDKTKDQLIDELEDLRKRVEKLETSKAKNKAEDQELQEREEIRSAVFSGTPDLVAVIDEQWTIIDINEAMSKRFGKHRNELIGSNGWNLLSKEMAESRKKYFEEVFRTGKPCHFEDERGGIYFENTVYPVLREKREVKRIAIHATDITESKTMEKKYQTILKTALDGFMIIDLDANMLEVNDSYCRMSGYSREELLTMSVPELEVLQSPEEVAERIKSKIIPGSDYFETKHKRKDGRIIDVEISSNYLNIDQGQFFVFLRDITERKRAEEALKESEEKLRLMFDSVTEGITLTDLNGRVVDTNEATAHIHGYDSKEQLTGRLAFEFIAERDHPKVKENLKKSLEHGQGETIEYVLLRGDGSEFPGEVDPALIRDVSGNPTGFVTITRDITERKQAEERINHLNLTLRSVRNVNQLITREKDRNKLLKGICNNLVKTHSYYNAWVVLLDESQGLVMHAQAGLGKDFSPVLEQLKEGELPACAQKAMTQRGVVVTRDPYFTCPGCSLSPSYRGRGGLTTRLEYEGTVYGILCASVPEYATSDKDEVQLFKEVATDTAFALRDIELEVEHRLLEEERAKVAKLESVGTLAGGIAHDFNNLLTGIMGNIGMAKRYTKPEDKSFDGLDEAEKAAGRAKDLTQQLLTFARGGTPVKKLSSLPELIDETAIFALRGSNVKHELSLADDLWAAEIDEGQIGQVIHNIIVNSDEAMPSGGIVRINVSNMSIKKAKDLPLSIGNYLQIDIKDEGIGMSPEQLQRIFEPYYTTKQKGSGLGLATAYAIIKNHGGYITAESGPGAGTTCHIFLPASEKTAPKNKTVIEQNPVQGKGKILVMDDEEIIRNMLSKMLSISGYQVELTGSGAEAISKYVEARDTGKPFDAIIMDLTIPGGMGGKEAIKELLKIDPRVKVIVSSGYATDPIMSDYKKYGFCAVITKPYSVSQMEETLHEVLKEKK